MNRWRTFGTFLSATCLLTAWATLAGADNWPQWRGAGQNGVSKDINLPAQWSNTQNIAWKLPLPGKGSSTPIVWGDRIFLTGSDGNDLVLLCVATEGKMVWKRKVGGGNKAFKGDETNSASNSPSTDGRHVYCFFATGDLACVDFQSNIVWSFNVQDRYGKFSIYHGIHTTPVLHEDRLYLTLLHSNAHWVIALDKTTGKEVWKHHRPTDAQGESEQCYTTPLVWNDGKTTSIVVVGCDYATGHRLTDGGEIWRVGELNPKSKYSTAFRIIGSPVAAQDLLIISTARGNGPVVALKPGARGAVKPGGEYEQWRVKAAPDVPSPLIHDGLVYLCGESGVLTCVDAKTGEQVYKERLHVSRYRASPVYADGKIYLTGRDGNFSVVKAGRKFELLATNELPDEFTASPAISNGRIYLRGFKSLYAVEAAGK